MITAGIGIILLILLFLVYKKRAEKDKEISKIMLDIGDISSIELWGRCKIHDIVPEGKHFGHYKKYQLKKLLAEYLYKTNKHHETRNTSTMSKIIRLYPNSLHEESVNSSK